MLVFVISFYFVSGTVLFRHFRNGVSNKILSWWPIPSDRSVRRFECFPGRCLITIFFRVFKRYMGAPLGKETKDSVSGSPRKSWDSLSLSSFSLKWIDVVYSTMQIFKYLASIHNARGDFDEAIRLDPTLNQVKLQLEEIKQTFDIVHHAIMKKVRIFSGIITISPLMSVSLHYPLRTSQNQNWKRSRPTPLCSKISTKVSPAVHSQHSVFLYLHTHTHIICAPLFLLLHSEKNPDKKLCGIVIQCASRSTDTPQIFICADRSDSRYVVALYDVAAHAVPDGATLLIPAPRLAPFTWDGKTWM